MKENLHIGGDETTEKNSFQRIKQFITKKKNILQNKLIDLEERDFYALCNFSYVRLLSTFSIVHKFL